MTNPAAAPGPARTYVQTRSARIADALSRRLDPPSDPREPLTAEQVTYLRQEAEELYWNELAWEELTEEEWVVGGPLSELVFPGFLTFVDGLLQAESPRGSSITARPRPELVQQILLFLEDRLSALTAELEAGADDVRVVWARAMTARLVDLVLFRLHRLSPREREEVDALD